MGGTATPRRRVELGVNRATGWSRLLVGALAACGAASANGQETPRPEERLDLDSDPGSIEGLDRDVADSWMPKVASVGDYVVSVWCDLDREPGGFGADIWLSYSWIVPAGESFTTPIRVDEDDTLDDFAPIVLAQENVTVVAWLKRRAGGKVEVWARSGHADFFMGGFDWVTPPRRVSTGLVGDAKGLTGAICLPYVWLAFEDDHNVRGTDDLFVAASANSGSSFSAPVQVNDPPGDSAEVNQPRLAVSLPESEREHDDEEGHDDDDHDDGDDDDDGDDHEDCCDDVFIVWGDRRSGGNDEVWFSRSLDGGVNWSANVRVDDAGSGCDADSPSIAAVACKGVFITWVDDRLNRGVADRPWFAFSVDAYDPAVAPTFAADVDLSTQVLVVDADEAQVVATHDLDVVVAWLDDRRSAGRDDVIVSRGLFSESSGTVVNGADANVTAAFRTIRCHTPVLRASEGAVGVAFLAPRTASGLTAQGALHPWLAFWDDTLAAPKWQLLHLATLAPRDQDMADIDFNLGDHAPWEGHIVWSTRPVSPRPLPRQIWIGGLDRDHGTGRPPNAPGTGAAIDPP